MVIGGAVAVTTIADGCPMVIVVCAVHKLTSLTVTRKVPAPTVKVLLVWNGGRPLFRLYCNAPVPPEAVTVNVVVPPLHVIVPADADTVIAEGSVTVTLTDELHPLASVTVYDCVPAACVKVPVPVYGVVPPVALIVTVDEPPLQAIAVWLSAATNCVG